MNKCPHCKSTISSLWVNGVTGHVSASKAWNCITLSCPSCGAVLGAQIDPIAIKTDIVDEVVRRLRQSN